MYVCICQAVTDKTIRRAAAEGVTTLRELTLRTGAGSQCGSCLPMAREILDDARPERNAQPAPAGLRIACCN
jgi:bacterioferritin-associated ferredoxin